MNKNLVSKNNQDTFFTLGALALILFSFCLLYWEHFPNLWSHWNHEDNNYCMLIPFLFAYLVYQARESISLKSTGPFWPAYIFLGLTGFVFLAGRLGSLETLVYASMWMVVVTLFILFLGIKAIKPLFFPFIVLAFAVPAPPFINRMLTFKLRLVSSKLAMPFFHSLNVPAYRQGNIIDLGVTQLQVVDACSGLRYFFPILVIGLVIGFLYHRSWWERVLILLLSVPVAVVANSLRIVAMGLAAKYIYPEFINTWFHEASGIGVFVVAVILLSIISLGLKKLSRLGPKNKLQSKESNTKENQEIGEARLDKDSGFTSLLSSKSAIHLLVMALLLVGLLGLEKGLLKSQSVPKRQSFDDFPIQIDHWTGKHQTLSDGILNSLWADDYVSGTYINKQTGNTLHLLIPFYEYQTTQHTAHAPTSCLLGGGFELRQKKTLPPNPKLGRDFPVHQMLLKQGEQRLLSNFWFEQRGRIITNEYLNKWYLFWDGLTRQRTDGALVRTEMVLLPGQSLDQGQRILDRFLAKLKDILPRYVPN